MSGSSLVIVLSGALPSGTSRKDKTKEIEAWGARVAKSVTNTCTHLVVSNINLVTKKTQDAKKKKVQVIDEDTLDRMMGTFSASKSSSSKQISSSSSSSSSSATTSSKTKVKKSNAKTGKNAKAKSKASSTKKMKATLSGRPPPSANSSIIDPFVVQTSNSSLQMTGLQLHSSFHTKLTLRENKSDKYYFVQVIFDTRNKIFYLYKRYGRTGTGGTAELVPFNLQDDAEKEFCKLFKSKTGLKWNERTSKPKSKKYVYTPDVLVLGKYQYYLQNDPHNKPDGWYDYPTVANDNMIGCYAQYTASSSIGTYNSTMSALQTRLIASGQYTYLVDFINNTQTNQTTGMTRPIRFVANSNTSSSSSSSRSVSATQVQPYQPQPPAPQPKANKKKRKAARPPTSISSSTSSTSSSLPLPLKKKPRTKTVKSKKIKAVLNNGSLATAADGTVDSYVPINLQPRCFNGNSNGGGSTGSVYGHFDAFGHQSIIAASKGGSNSNKMYRTQLLEQPTSIPGGTAANGGSKGVYLYNRFGKVGEVNGKNPNGEYTLDGPYDSEDAIKKFKSTFRTKFGNKWDDVCNDRDSFVKQKDRYGLDQLAPPPNMSTTMPSNMPSVPSSLNPQVKDLVNLVTNQDMFKKAMKDVNIDPAKLPAGMLMPNQISQGIEALEAIETAINRSRTTKKKLIELSNVFYQAIPMSSGYATLPVIDTQEMVDEKFELMTLMEQVSQGMSLSLGASDVDTQYRSLSTKLNLVVPQDADYSLVHTYFENTKGRGTFNGGGWNGGSRGKAGTFNLKNIFRAERDHEKATFNAFDHLNNRRLLWHGTNVAVVSAILKSGLRIMPHSGGRVGKGIYLADMHEKSGGYCTGSDSTVIMFLVEAPLGNMHEITRDDSSLVAPPSGFDSVRAKGTISPDETRAAYLTIDGKQVMVPQTKPITVNNGSSFHHNEYLVYREEQHRIRYVLEFEIGSTGNSSDEDDDY